MEITTRQLCLIIFINIFAVKALSLPSVLFKQVGTDSIFVILLAILIEIVIWWLLIKAFTHFSNTDFAGAVRSFLGEAGAKLICVLVLILYLYKLFFFFKGSLSFVFDTLTNEITWASIVVPALLVCCFVAYRGVRTIGRLTEVLSPFIFFGLVIAFAFSCIDLPVDGMLPLFTHPAKDIFSALVKTNLYYGNYILVFMFLGKVKIDKDFDKKLVKWLAISFVFLMTFLFIFYSTYNELGGLHQYAIADIAEFSLRVGSLAKFDWYISILMLLIIVLEIAMYIYVIYECLRNLFKRVKPNTLFFISGIVLIVGYCLLRLSPNIIDYLTFNVFNYYAVVVNLLIPIIIFIALMRGRGKYAKVT